MSVGAEKGKVDKDSDREPDNVTPDVSKTDGSNQKENGQERPKPSVPGVPQSLLQTGDKKRSPKSHRSSMSVLSGVNNENELNVSCAWRTLLRSEHYRGEQVNVDDE